MGSHQTTFRQFDDFGPHVKYTMQYLLSFGTVEVLGDGAEGGGVGSKGSVE